MKLSTLLVIAVLGLALNVEAKKKKCKPIKSSSSSGSVAAPSNNNDNSKSNGSGNGSSSQAPPKTKKPKTDPLSNQGGANGQVGANGEYIPNPNDNNNGGNNSNNNSQASSEPESSSSSSQPATSTPSTGSSGTTKSGFLQFENGVGFGLLPDDGSGGGSTETFASLANDLNGKPATFGYYAQAQSGKTFDGSQLLHVIDQVKASGAIFEPAVMPTGGWQGLTDSDNSQAVNICNVMKKFTDQGIETRLRFAHEVNWYQRDGTYNGNSDDFKKGWSAVAKACKQIAPDVKMFFTPNVASLSDYEKFFPDDPKTVDFIGIDYYPNSVEDTTFVDAMKPFHDKYTTGDYSHIKFAIGETGLGKAADISARVAWAKQAAMAKSEMPNLVSITWFNYQKGYDFKIVGKDEDDSKIKALLSVAP